MKTKPNYITLPKRTLREIFLYGVKNYPNSLAFVGLSTNKSYTYSQVYEQVQKVKKVLYDTFGFKKGDKIAIWAENSPNWGIAFFAVTTSGLVAVPLLPDFTAHEVNNILKHSEAKAIFVSKKQLAKYKELGNILDKVILLDDFTQINDLKNFDLTQNTRLLDQPLDPEKEYDVDEEDLAFIVYTSGTTGKSKGVMLLHRNTASNVLDIQYVEWLDPGEKFLSILPLSHTYENTVGFLAPFLHGSTIYYLEKPPTASLLLPALRKVKPTYMLSVPLIIEKIYRKNILPEINKNKITKNIYKTSIGRKLLNRLAGKKLLKIFGGELKFFGIGGAKLDPEVELFLRQAKFPYAIGYGMTETGPLLAGANPREIRYQSCGKPVRSVKLKIKDPDPKTGEGEIIAKGPNVMKGYYKEPELTKQTFTEDGWIRTGDLGVFDKDGFLYIKGRIKNLILGPSGENIYPEEIEAIINSFENVNESLVIEREGKLVALVHFDFESIEKKATEWIAEQCKKANDYLKCQEQKLKDKYTAVNQYLEHISKQLKEYVNQRVNRSSRIAKVEIQKEPFVKTATKKIKRFMYQNPKNKS